MAVSSNVFRTTTVVDNSGANQITWSCLDEAITVFSSAGFTLSNG